MSGCQLTKSSNFVKRLNMNEISEDPKAVTILSAAWNAFAAQGYRNTSMDDIARRAGMSRPALYLHYKNKEDIYRSLARIYCVDAARDVEKALAGDGSVRDVLANAFAAQGGALIKAMLSSPHGLELLDSGTTRAADIIAAGEARLRAIYAAWLEEQSQAGTIRLSGPAPEVAATITAALKGIKAEAPEYSAYAARVSQLATLIGAGLTASDSH